ncbi:MAG: hypothetical protein ACRECT_01015 [Thermoplasmata archaeon]
MAPRPLEWTNLAFYAKAGGFLLVFIGTLVLVTGTNPSTAPNFNILYDSILAGRLLWAIGLAAIATGAGIKLRYVYPTPNVELSDSRAGILRASMGRNMLLFVVALFLMVFILTLGS